MNDLVSLFLHSLLISLMSFSGSAQALFYQTGIIQMHWLNSSDFSAVLAFGYATPGPAVFGIATFMGYRLGGIFGAAVGTIGIFAVPLTAAVVSARYLGHFLNSRHARHVIKGVGLAAAGLVAATGLHLLHPASLQWWQIGITVASCVIFIRRKNTNPLIILAVSGCIGFLASS